MLTVFLQFGYGLVDLACPKFSQIDCAFNTVIEGCDSCRVGVFALAYNDSSLALSNSLIVISNIFSESEEAYLSTYEWLLDWQSTNLSYLTPLSSLSAI